MKAPPPTGRQLGGQLKMSPVSASSAQVSSRSLDEEEKKEKKKKKRGGLGVKAWGRQGWQFLTSQESSETGESTRVDRLFMLKQVQ